MRRVFSLLKSDGAFAPALAWATLAMLMVAATSLLGGVMYAGAVGADRHPEPFGSFTQSVAFGRTAIDLLVPLAAAFAGVAAARPGARWRGVAVRAGSSAAGLVIGSALGFTVAFVLTLTLGTGAAAPPFWSAVTAVAAAIVTFAALGLAIGTAVGARGAVVAAPVAAGLVVVTGPLWDTALLAAAFKAVGVAALQSGELPTWILAVQGLNPLTAYKALLVMLEPGFANALENRALGGGLPGWVNAWLFAGLLTAWTTLAVGVTVLVAWWRGGARSVTAWGFGPAVEPDGLPRRGWRAVATLRKRARYRPFEPRKRA